MQTTVPTCTQILWLLLFTTVTCELQWNDYIIKSTDLPDVRFRPVIGNGHIATNVLSDTVYMNGLFNGREDKSSRARIPGYMAIDVMEQENVTRKYELNMRYGLFRQYVQTPEAQVTLTYYAHRKHAHLLVTTLEIHRVAAVDTNITIPLQVNKGNKSNDFADNTHQMQSEQNKLQDDQEPYRYYSGTVKDMEVPDTPKSQLHIYHLPIPNEVTLPPGQNSLTKTYIAAMSQNILDAKNSLKKGIGYTMAKTLLQQHKEAWNAVWSEGRVDIEGNKELSKTVVAATYYIMCSVPDKQDPHVPFFGLSPGGLSRGGLLVPNMPGGGHNDYAGHVFWDMDTWMMPPIMMLHPNMARLMIGSRTRVLEQVKTNAKQAGYHGAKYPWEQAATGIEATPKWAGNTSRFQIHITADIAYGLRQYLYATNDETILTPSSQGFELAMETARFWQSRVTFSKNKKRAEILGVMGPDEYHFNISNSIYTNYNAKLNLLLPQYIVDTFKMEDKISAQTKLEIAEFKKTADIMYMLFDNKLKYHPQYEGFNRSLTIKQSDVILLGYPLMMPMSKEVRRNDLEIYESITDPSGPDTGTWSMHTVGWLELGDEARAQKNFMMMLRNVNDPFKTFSENPVTNTSNGGCVNFITAAGGLLQSVVFGYGGLRLYPDRLAIHPYLLPNSSSWTLTGVHYKGIVLDIVTDKSSFKIKPIHKPDNLMAVVKALPARQYILKNGETVEFPRQEVSVYVKRAETTPSSASTILPYMALILVHGMFSILCKHLHARSL